MENLMQEKKAYKSYIVTSCKGGIGKSTVTANLAAAMADTGHRVLTVDCDFSNRSLDLIFGCEGEILADISELAAGKTTPGKAVVKVPVKENLFFIPAPVQQSERFTSEQLSSAISLAAQEYRCDIVIIDTPGAADWILPVIAPAADAALIVASHMPTSIRAAEKTGFVIGQMGVSEKNLIINRFDEEKVLSRERPGINRLIDETKVPLIGIIPESRLLELSQEKGVLVSDVKKHRNPVRDAFSETARRILGENIKIMSYLPERRRRKLLNS